MNIVIRKAGENDFENVFQLIKELAVFQNASDKVINTVERMIEEQEHLNCFVALDDHDNLVGLVTYFFTYFTWVGKSLYVDDLIVKEPYRGNKIGTKLLKKIFEVASAEKCNRVRWQVSDWNHDAVAFYEKCGAEIETGICNCDFDPRAIQDFSFRI